ncbi:EKC/KEOPS complex subunit Tprkb [Gossypium australe]|uniref:EKC/KEOPS complex subunit Tprkb n=1 Tax=Gossypium australe TaxID=47621 RepID=A0A5B6WMB9_9ROSI|nr:EKC/KEOPS complex subunit Tprkb [Gossypium australe]
MKVFEIHGNTLSLTLFIEVTNSKDLKESMQAGKLDPEVSFLNASLIPDVFPVPVAACKALSPVHSEFVYNYLSP